MTRTFSTPRTLQLWPSGASVEFRGDPDGNGASRSLRTRYTANRKKNPWRRGSAAEWEAIRIALRAEMYAERYILRNQTALVSDLIRAGSEMGSDIGNAFGDVNPPWLPCKAHEDTDNEDGILTRCPDCRPDYAQELANAFGDSEIRNLYRDFSGASAADVRAYAKENGVELPALPCACDGRHTIATQCPEYVALTEDDSRHGWLTEARDACRDHASENPAAVYEWYLVDAWLCEQLHAIGEVTIDNGYGHWWGRTCSGQALIMDGTLQAIAAKFETYKL